MSAEFINASGLRLACKAYLRPYTEANEQGPNIAQ